MSIYYAKENNFREICAVVFTQLPGTYCYRIYCNAGLNVAVSIMNFYFAVVLFAVSAVYFAGVMVRLMLTLTPVVCVLGGIAFSRLFEVYLKVCKYPC